VTGIGTAVDPVLEELERAFDDGSWVTAIGGGHGLARALQAVVGYAGSISAVVTVADDGGSSGRLSPALSIPPPGDIRRALLALSPESSPWRAVVEYRFSESDVAGHSLGNLLLAALTEIRGDFDDAIQVLGGLLGARGTVTPAATAPLTLEADVDGDVIRGQVAIARGRGRVSGLRVRPADAPASPAALAAIAAADQIVLGPGSLFTSVLAALVVDGIADAVNDSSAMLVYVCNLITQDGETLDMSGPEHVAALGSIAGLRPPDRVVAHEGPLDVPPGLARVAFEDELPGLVRADVADRTAAWPEHDPALLGAVLRRLV
jgi:uncharacterized cofD-like protein